MIQNLTGNSAIFKFKYVTALGTCNVRVDRLSAKAFITDYSVLGEGYDEENKTHNIAIEKIKNEVEDNCCSVNGWKLLKY